MEKPGHVTAKPPDTNFAIKISKTFLTSRAVQDALVSRAIALLAYPIARSLKMYAKKCKVSQWSTATKALAQKLEKQIESVIRAREKITGAPGDLKDTKVVN